MSKQASHILTNNKGWHLTNLITIVSLTAATITVYCNQKARFTLRLGRCYDTQLQMLN